MSRQAVQVLYGLLDVFLTSDFNSDLSGDAYQTLVGLDYMGKSYFLAAKCSLEACLMSSLPLTHCITLRETK